MLPDAGAQASGAMVTSPHALATQAGIAVLRDGGNAADAIVAVGAALAVLYPHMTGIGGDAFFLYYDAAAGRVHAYNGSGAAAGLARREYYAERGHARIPQRGAAAALTVPGAVDAWFSLVERFGSRPVRSILAPAIAYARDGAPVARSFAAAVVEVEDHLARDEGAARLFLGRGRLETGAMFSNPGLARTLQAIASEGRSWFYHGPGAKAIADHAELVGSPLRAADFAAHAGSFSEAVAGRFFGFDSLTVPPNSQGIALLVAQQTYEAYLAGHPVEEGGAAQVHAGIESIKLAVADRDALVTDPSAGDAWRQVLSLDHARANAARIDPNAAMDPPRSGADRGGTTYFACVDGAGNAASYIQSLYLHFGAAVVVPELGIVLQNRGILFDLDDGIRALAPGKRPYHTLMPCMLMRDGKPALVYGSMGGDGQPQIALQNATKIVLAGIGPQAALDCPRWLWSRGGSAERHRLFMEDRFSAACVAGLRARGHDVQLLGEWEEFMGHAGAILIDPQTGVRTGASDRRSDGSAAGF
jgi:gamma-glutamyltranspeptidase